MANLFSSLTSLFKKDSESVLGVDVGVSSIKLVQLRKKKGRAVLETYGEVSLGPYAQLSLGQATNLPPDIVGGALRDLMKESNVTAKSAAFAIPLASSLVSLIEVHIPPGAPLAQMIPLEARKYIPVPVSEVTLDWWVIPKRQNGFDDSLQEKNAASVPAKPDSLAQSAAPVPVSEVLLVAIHNAMLERYRSIAREAGLAADVFEIESFSTVRAVIGDELVPTLLLDIGAASTKIVIVDYGIVRISHVVSHGGQEITLALSKSQNITFEQAEEKKRQGGLGESLFMGSILDALFYEANQVISNYQKKYSRTISKVYLVGGGSLLIGVKEEAQKRFGVDVFYGDPFGKTDTPAFLSQVLSKAGPEFAVAVGLALRKLQSAA
jgi:type IV pilus assembly protein PilM